MMEITINDNVFEFNFGMGFLREINKRVATPVDGLKDVKQNIGLRYMVSGILDGDVEALVEVLDVANKGQNPRITKNSLDAYVEDENTDIDALFAEVLDFLKKANVTKKTVVTMLEAVDAQKAKAAK